MTEEELLAMLSTSSAGIRGAQNAPLAATRTPLANIEANAPPAYRVPLMRAGGTREFVYPGFGIDPEINPGTSVPPGGTPTGSSGGGTPAGSGIDINALLAGLGGSGGILAGGGSSSGGGLGNLAGGAGLTVAALGALLKAAPWLARQLGLTDQQAAALTATTPVGDLIGPDGAGAQAIDPDPTWNLNELTPTTPVEDLLGPDGRGAQAVDPDPNWQPNTLTPTTPISDLIGPDGPGAAAIDPDPGWSPGGAPLTPTTPVQNLIGPDGPGALAIDPADPMFSLNFGDFGSVPAPGADFGPPGGMGEWSGTGGEFSGFGGPLIDPGSLGIPDTSFDLMGFNVDPMSLAGGAIGSWGGGRLASSLVEGDEQQAWSSKLGGLAGGAIGSLIFPGVGTLLGSFLGSLGAGTLGAGEPDYGYGYFGANVGAGDAGPQLNFWSPDAQNNGSTSGLGAVSASLQKYLADRAANEGYSLNPEMINTAAFSAGRTEAPGGKWFVGGRDVSPAQAAYDGRADWRSDDMAALPEQVWNSLVGRGIYAKPGTFTDWQTVRQNVDQQRQDSYTTPVYVEHGEAGGWTEMRPNDTPTYSGSRASDPVGYWTETWSGGGEAGDFQTRTWNPGTPAPAPESTSVVEPQQAAPMPEPMNYDQGGAAREGGLIPPTPGGTKPVPLQAHTGEFVIRPEAVAKFGPEMLTAINRGTFPHQMPADGETDVVDGMEDEMHGYGEDESEYAGFDAFTRPYADVEDGAPSPFERVTSEATGGDPMAALRDLPPEVQQGMLMALGMDPLIASAWLQVLGPEYQQVIAEALKAAGAMKQQQAMAMAPPPMPGAPAAAPAPGMMG